jgi:hypothetical protein
VRQSYYLGTRPLLTMTLKRPDVRFYCDLDYDPFLIMQDQNKVYGTLLSGLIVSQPSKSLQVSPYHSMSMRPLFPHCGVL